MKLVISTEAIESLKTSDMDATNMSHVDMDLFVDKSRGSEEV